MGQGAGVRNARTVKLRSGSGKVIARGRTFDAMGRQKKNFGSPFENAKVARNNYKAAAKRKGRNAAPKPSAR